MPIPTPTIHRVALIVFLICGLILLADGSARIELAQAVGASWHDAARTVASAADTAD